MTELVALVRTAVHKVRDKRWQPLLKLCGKRISWFCGARVAAWGEASWKHRRACRLRIGLTVGYTVEKGITQEMVRVER